jgi:hypothetical protein
MSVTAGEARQRTAYLVSADEYRSLKETAHLLQSPVDAQRLRESLAEASEGRAEAHDGVATSPAAGHGGSTRSTGSSTWSTGSSS